MNYNHKNYTVESVTSGHPDKVCDQISDAILDECLRTDPQARVAIESFGGHGKLFIGGEITINGKIDFVGIAQRVYKNIGYPQKIEIITAISQQSPDIAQGVDTGGAGDQGIMYGYATDETKEFLPIGVVLAHKLSQGLEKLRTSGKIKWLKPDGKTQVTMEKGKIKTILVSTQHAKNVSQKEIRETLIQKLIKPIIKNLKNVEILINPTGNFEVGGFEADTGLTGRKIMVDTYGGLIPHGGGAFSGKDATKVDRSAAYMARYVAKNMVANKLAKKCLVSVAYAIGKVEPVMIEVINEKGENLSQIAKKHFNFRPQAIIERLGLRKPIFSRTSAYGHFGKKNLSWEKIIKFKK